MFEAAEEIFRVWITLFEKLGNAPKDQLASFFLWLIVLVFLTAVFQLVFKRKWLKRLFDIVPSVLISLGILGTFLGIAIGLAEFDPSNISASVERLIEGLKIAFATSILGMGLSTALKVSKTIVISYFEEKERDELVIPVQIGSDGSEKFTVEKNQIPLFLLAGEMLERIQAQTKELNKIRVSTDRLAADTKKICFEIGELKSQSKSEPQ